VRKSEKATAIVFWKTEANDGDEFRAAGDEISIDQRIVGRVYHVFNASQVYGAEQPAGATATLKENERISAAESFFGGCNAKVQHGGDQAFYLSCQDRIHMPRFEQFRDPASYYSVLGHEHIHWTGARHRLNRDLRNRFGTDAYAIEELIAELGSAFLAGHLGISLEPRRDHAAYLASWLRQLRRDTRAILTVSGKAQNAVDFLVSHAASCPTTY